MANLFLGLDLGLELGLGKVQRNTDVDLELI